MFINQVVILQEQKRYAFNWLNLYTVFTATLTLIYSIVAQPQPLPTYLRRTTALEDLKIVARILAVFGQKFPSSLKCRDIVEDVIQRLEQLVDAEDHNVHGDVLDPFAASRRGPETFTTDGDSTTAYPMYATSNPAYDGLQQQIGRLGSSSGPASTTAFSSHPAFGELAPDNTTNNPNMSTAEFGNAAAQLMASGLGGSADMDLDEEMLQFLGATSDSWGV